MTAVIALERELSTGFKVRRLRTSQFLTQQKLADMAGVSPEEVDAFEHNRPVKLGVRCKILKELLAIKTGK